VNVAENVAKYSKFKKNKIRNCGGSMIGMFAYNKEHMRVLTLHRTARENLRNIYM